MPIKITKTSLASNTYASPFLGPVDHTVQVNLVLSGLSDDEIDARGWLKPGIPFAKDGTLVGAADFVYGVTIEPTKVADDNEAATIAALPDQWVGLAVIGCVIQDMAETFLGRAYTADEIAGFDRAGSKLVLIS